MALKLKSSQLGWLYAGAFALAFLTLQFPFSREITLRALVPGYIVLVVLMLSQHKGWSIQFAMSFVLVGFCGYLIEVLGTHTGLICGKYSYGRMFPFQIWNVPVLIGLVFAVNVYVCRGLAEKIFRNPVPALIAAAGFNLVLQIISIPFLRNFEWLQFQEKMPTLRFSIVIFAIFLIIQYLYIRATPQKPNPPGIVFYGLLLCFMAGFQFIYN